MYNNNCDCIYNDVEENMEELKHNRETTAEKTRIKNTKLTMPNGQIINDDKNSLSVGSRGPVVLRDSQLTEKLAYFNRERIPERVVHAKGFGAYGFFKPYRSMEKYTKACFLQNPNKTTKTFVRFSTVTGSKGSADTERDPRGFAVKFYTDEGNFDILGFSLPVFFVKDAMKFVDIMHALKNSPKSNLKDRERLWDFYSKTPESTHIMTWLYSDLGTIKDYKNMDGFGVNTYVWVNKEGKKTYVKYHFKTLHGVKTISRQEAEKLAGENPDIAGDLLYSRLKNNKPIQYEFCIQAMEPCMESELDFDPLDPTKMWPEDKFPLIKVGNLTLNCNPENYFTEVEQAAFSPSNTIDGIEFSNDKVLQPRSFAYTDAQRYRLGTNFMQLPVNAPISHVDNNMQDGTLRMYNNKRDTNYLPNRLYDNMPYTPEADCESSEIIRGRVERRALREDDDFYQAGEKYLSLSKKEREALVDNIASELHTARKDIRNKCIEYFFKANKEYGIKVEQRIRDYLLSH